MPSEDSTRITAELAALTSTDRLDAAGAPRVDFWHGTFPPLPSTTVPALGADQLATQVALRAAVLSPDIDSAAVVRTVDDAVTLAADTLVTSATASFVAGDAGAAVTLRVAGEVVLESTIATVTNGTDVELADPVTDSDTDVSLTISSCANAETPAAASTVTVGSTVVVG